MTDPFNDIRVRPTSDEAVPVKQLVSSAVLTRNTRFYGSPLQPRMATALDHPTDGRRGATMVEFALFFLLFLMLAVGLMELGRGIWTYTTLAHAARQGARYALVHGLANPIAGDDPSIEAVVKANAVGLDGSEISVLTTWDPANEPGSVVEVQVRYPFRLAVAPLILAQDSIQMGSTSRMIMAN